MGDCVRIGLFAISVLLSAEPQNRSDTLENLRRAAENGDAKAQSDLGWRYHTAAGVPKDFGEALKWYRKAVEQGEASALNRIGVCYEKGEGVDQDFTQALQWFLAS